MDRGAHRSPPKAFLPRKAGLSQRCGELLDDQTFHARQPAVTPRSVKPELERMMPFAGQRPSSLRGSPGRPFSRSLLPGPEAGAPRLLMPSSSPCREIRQLAVDVDPGGFQTPDAERLCAPQCLQGAGGKDARLHPSPVGTSVAAQVRPGTAVWRCSEPPKGRVQVK